MKNAETKNLSLSIKSVTDEGKFVGILSVYDIVDRQNDVIEKGAFAKSIAESGSKLPLRYEHIETIGTLELKDTDTELIVAGEVCMDLNADGSPQVPKAIEALALMKMGAVNGLSIDYQSFPDKTRYENGIRYLKEVRLYGGSVVTFPANQAATILSVKAGRTISTATGDSIREAIRILEALLDPEAAGTSPDEGKAAGTETAGAAQQGSAEPEPQAAAIHSLLKQSIRERSVLWTPKN